MSNVSQSCLQPVPVVQVLHTVKGKNSLYGTEYSTVQCTLVYCTVQYYEAKTNFS